MQLRFAQTRIGHQQDVRQRAPYKISVRLCILHSSSFSNSLQALDTTSLYSTLRWHFLASQARHIFILEFTSIRLVL